MLLVMEHKDLCHVHRGPLLNPFTVQLNPTITSFNDYCWNFREKERKMKTRKIKKEAKMFKPLKSNYFLQ
jgi:hypothetical protein